MRNILLFLVLVIPTLGQAQKFTLADTLRGTLSPIRSCFDVTYYDLHVSVDIEEKSISGVNHIHFKNKADFDSLQIDLFDNMTIDSILQDGQKLQFSRLFNAVFVSLPVRQAGFPSGMKKGETGVISVYYRGTPIAAKNAPWDGGFVWKEDSNGKPFVGVACEGTGASLWWPNKDHLSDEPDSMRISCTIPNGLMCVSNGELESQQTIGGKTTWNWKVSNPINNYNVTLNIADYAHFSDHHINTSGDSLKLDYYVLKENVEKAKKQFQQVHGMMDCFEEAFGNYPFYKDGYALVETSYLGMEHQGAIAYGNQYKPGYLGRFPSNMDFDYIIIHETGHEWWGNSVSMNDMADMWIHESFCTYSEAVFVECTYGYEKMLEYLLYQRSFISNRSPIYGTYGMNHEGNSTDMYYKGAWMLHTFRNVLNNDSLFSSVIKGIAQEFALKNVDGQEVINYINGRVKYNYTPFFNQYLRFKNVPVLEYRFVKKKAEMRWKAAAKNFRMPVVYVLPSAEEKRVLVTNQEWVSVPISKKNFKELKFRKDLFLFIAKKLP